MRPVPRRASSRASLTRCASPPESVVAGWPSVEVAEADVARASAACRAIRGTPRRRSQRLLDRHVEHVGDRLAAELHLQRLAVVALALADVAGDPDVGQEVHLDR